MESPDTPSDPTDQDASDEASSSDVYRIDVDGRHFILVGTAHISQESVDLVHSVIEQERPDRVCVELDEQRHAALTQKRNWDAMNLRQVIRDRQLATLLINILLMSFQKRLGGKLGVMPGSELVEAVKTAESHDIPVSLCDRDIRVTLGRAWQSIAWYRKLWLLASTIASAFESPELDEDELRRIRSRDVMSELLGELGASMPTLKRVLIDERDAYLAHRMRESEGQKVIAVVGAGHVEGMLAALARERESGIAELDIVPPSSPVWSYVGWAIPVAIVGMLIAIGVSKGAEAAGDNLVFWILANSLPTALGCIIAIGHPLTVLVAFVVAPFTSLTPLIGAGYVAAFTQAWIRPPRVHEFSSVADDIVLVPRWWSNRLLRVFLVFILASLLGAIGTWVGGYEIISNLVT
jgi:pheromone shutdown-related protein TraB